MRRAAFIAGEAFAEEMGDRLEHRGSGTVAGSLRVQLDAWRRRRRGRRSKSGSGKPR